MQINFEAKELKKAKEHVKGLNHKEEELKNKKENKSSSFLKDLFKFLFK